VRDVGAARNAIAHEFGHCPSRRPVREAVSDALAGTVNPVDPCPIDCHGALMPDPVATPDPTRQRAAPMRLVLLGGAPGIGKTAVAREFLSLAVGGTRLTQWVDVDALWAHQPWEVSDRTTAMVQANLRAVIANADAAGIELLLVTWVFQNQGMHDLVRSLSPRGLTTITVQLHAEPESWRRRFGTDPERPELDDFYRLRYYEAQRTPSDHVLNTDGKLARVVAAELAALLAD
jgi:hypothetical protein